MAQAEADVYVLCPPEVRAGNLNEQTFRYSHGKWSADFRFSRDQYGNVLSQAACGRDTPRGGDRNHVWVCRTGAAGFGVKGAGLYLGWNLQTLDHRGSRL